MSDLLVTAQIDTAHGNGIVISYSSDAANWCTFPIPQSSKASPAVTVWNGNLWTAFQSNQTSMIFTASLSDWSGNVPIGQSSQTGPALTVFQNELWVAYIGEDTGNIELVSSSDGTTHWSSKIVTGQSSKVTPALAVFKNELWVAYIGAGSGVVELISSADGIHWSPKTLTGQSSNLAPSLTALEDELWVAYIGQASGNVELVSSSNWSVRTLTGQSSNFAPSLTVFENELWIAYIGQASGNVELVSSSNWSARILTGQSSNLAAAVTDIPAATPPKILGGRNQYIFAHPSTECDQYVALKNLVVEIKITESLVVSPTSGIEPGETTPQPIGFQINGFSQKGDQTISWQQYGFRMRPGATRLIAFAESWPPGSGPNVFQLTSPNIATLPTDLMIPAGWTIRFEFDQQADGTITGFKCPVTDATGANVGNLDMALLGRDLAAGGPIGQDDLALMVAFQVVLVGYWASAQATLVSGAGTITCSSSTPLLSRDSWPCNADGHNGTAEETNCFYGLVPAQESLSVVQFFGVPHPKVTNIQGLSEFAVSGTGFIPNDPLTLSYELLGGGSAASESNSVDCIAANDGSFSCAISPQTTPGRSSPSAPWFRLASR